MLSVNELLAKFVCPLRAGVLSQNLINLSAQKSIHLIFFGKQTILIDNSHWLYRFKQILHIFTIFLKGQLYHSRSTLNKKIKKLF